MEEGFPEVVALEEVGPLHEEKPRHRQGQVENAESRHAQQKAEFAVLTAGLLKGESFERKLSFHFLKLREKESELFLIA